MTRIDYYYFPISPFTYLAGTRLEQIAAEHGAEILYKPVQLMRIFAETGTPPPKERHASRQSYRLADIARVARANGMAINLQPAHWPTNPVPASSALIAAQDAGGGDLGGLAHAFCRACWAEDRDIADDAVIRDLLSACDFDPGLADRGLLSGSETIERNTEEALRAMVFGAPSYVVDGEVFWGQDRLAHLAAKLAA